ncbi:MAG: V-type ATP synthase subunit E family protein [Candidatus Hermodarchaeota archaeon]
MSKEKYLKESVGNLGLYLIEKAQQEINEIHKQTLFQKAELRKKFDKQIKKSSMRIRNSFVETYNQFLNTQITTVLLKSKEKILNLKNSLLKEFKITLLNSIKERINSNYSNYINFILNYIKEISKNVDSPPEIMIFFNSKDYKYFKTKFEKLQKFFKNTVSIKEDKSEFIGGFKLLRKNAIVSYDYTLDHLIELQKTLIEMQFSSLIADNEYKQLEIEFEKLIENKKKDILEYLRKYDQIEYE